MRILIAVASRHGSTREIATRLAERFVAAGHSADVLELAKGHRRDDVDGYDGYIIGSAIYEGHWLRPARTFVLDNATALQRAPVWLFSSGPVGDDQQTNIDNARIDELAHAVDARDHHVFAGRLVRDELGRLERWVVDVVHAREGDYREWSAIDDWAAEIAGTFNDAANASS